MTQHYVRPTFNANSFTCPSCNVLTQVQWFQLDRKYHQNDRNYSKDTALHEAQCTHCGSSSYWDPEVGVDLQIERWSMVYPRISMAPRAHEEMPDDVLTDYTEASLVAQDSSKAAAALLRLALQKLCVHLGQSGRNINNDIRALAQDSTIPAMVVTIADTIRITGNNAVHPGQMDDEDVETVANQMFSLINLIVEKGISEPRKLRELYEMTPEATRQAAENADAQN